MKKFFFLIMTFSAALASCSKNEVVNAPGADTPISFYTYTGRAPETKATVATKADLAESGFQVYAFMNAAADYVVAGEGTNQDEKPYMNKHVTSSDEGANWTYTGNIYWPASNYLDFVAYGKNANVTEDAYVRTKIYYTIPTTVADQKDLLVAAPVLDRRLPQGQNVAEADEYVALQFSHLLSKVGFSLVAEGDKSTLVTLTQVDLVGNFYSECEVDLTATMETTLNSGENGATVTAERPYVSPKNGSQQSVVTYKLLGDAIGTTGADDASFTCVGTNVAQPVFDNSASYTLTDPDNKNAVKFVANGVAESEDNKENRFMMVYPVQDWGTATVGSTTLTNAQLVVTYFLPEYGEFETLTIDVKNGNNAITFDPGKSYEFKLKVSTYEIGVSAEVDIWYTDDTMNGKDTFILC